MTDPSSSDFYPRVDNIFLDTVDDLLSCSSLRSTPYGAIRSAMLVRKLLLDGRNSLWTLVNREHGLKLEYAVGPLYVCVKRRGGTCWARGLWLDPMLARLNIETQAALDVGGGLAKVGWKPPPPISLDEFLAAPVVVDGERNASVKDVVKLYANELGGAHFGAAKKGQKNELLQEMIIESEPFLRQSMIAIARIVHRAMEPLTAIVVLSERAHPFGFTHVGDGGQ